MADFISHPIPAMVLMLGILVFVHESGHFLVGRLSGIAVEIFSIGFGHRIWGFRHKGTDYRICWIPLGGYVKFAGAHPSEDVPKGIDGIPFREASLSKRVMAISAGPIANLLLAALIYAVLVTAGIPHPPAIVGEVLENTPAEKAGLVFGDRLKFIDGHVIDNWKDLEKYISKAPGRSLKIIVDRDGKDVTLSLTPDKVEGSDMIGRKVFVGRAGIALGRPPAIISVASDSTLPASKAGLSTGDQVTKLAYLDKVFAIDSFPQLTQQMVLAKNSGAVNVNLTLKRAPLPDQKSLTAGAERTIELPLNSVPKDVPAKEWVRSLGILSSDLTVGRVMWDKISTLKVYDRLVAWKGHAIQNIFQLQEKIEATLESEVEVTLVRDGKLIVKTIPLKGVEVQKPQGKETVFTFPVAFLGQRQDPKPVIQQYDNPFMALYFGLSETAKQTGGMVIVLGNLIAGEIPLKALGGPMLIAKVAGDSAKHGWQTFLASMALISVNLGVLNLFPIPVLDGGQLVLLGCEAIRRRPLKEAAIENFQKVGFAMILSLVVLATYNDFSRFWKSMLETLVGVFQ